MQTVRQAVHDKSYKYIDFLADGWDRVKAIKPRDSETVFRKQRTDKQRQPHIARL